MTPEQKDEILAKAAEYGRKVREIDDSAENREEERKKLRKEWSKWRVAFGEELRQEIITAYWDEYCAE